VYKEGAATNITCGFLANDIAEVRTEHTLPGGERVIIHHQKQAVLGEGAFRFLPLATRAPPSATTTAPLSVSFGAA
jgi:hypothetical protein